jgi:hypothetical protein
LTSVTDVVADATTGVAVSAAAAAAVVVAATAVVIVAEVSFAAAAAAAPIASVCLRERVEAPRDQLTSKIRQF